MANNRRIKKGCNQTMATNLENNTVANQLDKINYIPIVKKKNLTKYANYHITSLISDTSKIMNRIIQSILQLNKGREMPDIQTGF